MKTVGVTGDEAGDGVRRRQIICRSDPFGGSSQKEKKFSIVVDFDDGRRGKQSLSDLISHIVTKQQGLR